MIKIHIHLHLRVFKYSFTKKINVRKTWSPHNVERWYLGPVMEYYRCYCVISSKTGGGRITDTVQFFPHDVPIPGISATDRAVKAAVKLTDTIRNFKHASPLKYIPSTQMAALTKLAEIFKVPTDPNNQKVTAVQKRGYQVTTGSKKK